MPDAAELIKAIKAASVAAVKAEKPVEIVCGQVTSKSPLTILVDQKMTLGIKQLILSRAVTDYTVEVAIDFKTDSEFIEHSHDYSGTTAAADEDNLHKHTFSGTTTTAGISHSHNVAGLTEIIVYNHLETGDKVILLRQQGGQKYIVLDRIG